MRVLFLGDIVGRAGRDAVVAEVPRLRRDLRLDLVIVNGENAASGFGLTAFAIVTMRMVSFAEFAISERESSARWTCTTMFDWPEHSHTSPTRTSLTVCVCSPERAVSV